MVLEFEVVKGRMDKVVMKMEWEMDGNVNEIGGSTCMLGKLERKTPESFIINYFPLVQNLLQTILFN
jgi:hypothetical protein